MVQLLILLFIALPLLRLILAIAWPGLLKRVEGRRAERALTRQFGKGQDDPRVSAIGDRLLSSQRIRASFQVLPGPIKNAITLPNGSIYIWEGLLAETGSDDDMLAGVLAHELGHLEHEHLLLRVQWAALARFVLGIIGGGLLRQLLQNATASAITRGFSRAQELQADETAITLMQAAGYNPDGLVRLLERIARDAPVGMPGTHPEPRTRASRLRTRLGLEAAPASKPASPPQEEAPKSGGTIIQFPGRKRS